MLAIIAARHIFGNACEICFFCCVRDSGHDLINVFVALGDHFDDLPFLHWICAASSVFFAVLTVCAHVLQDVLMESIEFLST